MGIEAGEFLAHVAAVGEDGEFLEDAFVGGIEIVSAPRRMTKYPVPDEIKAQYKETYEITTTSIDPVVAGRGL